MSSSYDDILYLPHPTSKTHPRMSRQDRAAQFSPFAALTGYENVVRETARLTEKRPELTEDEMAELDTRLHLAMEMNVKVVVTWFQPDSRKSGGSYITATGRIKKADELQHTLTMEDGTQIPVNEIIDIDGSILYMA